MSRNSPFITAHLPFAAFSSGEVNSRLNVIQLICNFYGTWLVYNRVTRKAHKVK